MCARYPTPPETQALLDQFRVGPLSAYEPQTNVAPTDAAPVVIAPGAGRELRYMKWGLLPHWAKDEKAAAKMINARLETVFEKPAYSRYIKRNRCIVPALGFFEWSDDKTPFLIRLRSGELMGFAGIWNRWHDPDEPDRVVETYAIVTTDANPIVGAIHDRMPALVPMENYRDWLDSEIQEPAAIASMLWSPTAEQVVTVQQERALNNARRKDVALNI